MTAAVLEWQQTWPARAENIAEARTAVTAYVRRSGGFNGLVQNIRLAVSEACSNAILHGYRGDSADAFTVGAARVGDTVEIVVRDHGCGMRPRIDSPGAGLGLPIISQLASHIEVRTPPDGRGTELRMTFELPR
jgi:serine/threonine-protein kinase RsbW/stage II sporulation protein AB (anti-sigma F factor)